MESRRAVNIILSRVLLLTLLFSTSIWTLPFAIPSALFSHSPENDLLASDNSNTSTDEKHEIKSKEEGVAETKGNLLNLNPISVNSPVGNNSLNSSENRKETFPDNADLSKLMHDTKASSPSFKQKRALPPQQPLSSPNIENLNDTNSGKEKPPEVSSDTGQITNASTRPASRTFADHEVSNVEATFANHNEPKRLPLEFVTTNRVYLTLLGDYDDAENKSMSGLDARFIPMEKPNEFDNATIFITLEGDTVGNRDETVTEQPKLNDSHSQVNTSSEAQDQEVKSKEQENPLEEKTDLDSVTDSINNSTTEPQPIILELYDSPAFYGRNIDIQDDFQVFEDRGCVDFSCKDDS